MKEDKNLVENKSIEDIIKENEMKDIKWLVLELMVGKTRQYLSAQDKAIATDIVNRMKKFL